MISILYPKDDYTSADIAIKLQALAADQANKIFIVPKHYGRNKENINKNLAKSRTAIFLSHDMSELDPSTRKELELLLAHKANVYSITPTQSKKSMILPKGITSHYYYDQQQPGDFLNTVKKIADDVQKKKNASSDFGALLVVMALIILVIAAFDNGKK